MRYLLSLRPCFKPGACLLIFMAILDESIRLTRILISNGMRHGKLILQHPRIDNLAMFTKTLAGLAFWVAATQSASAADWQYCLAPSHTEHKVYLSQPFPSGAAGGSPDSVLDRKLSQSGIMHDVVQCPRADDKRSIEVMRQEAISFNHIAGNEVVNLDWKP
jgi:hypothetical protein